LIFHQNESEVPVSSKAEAVDEPETTVNNHSSQENDNDDSKTRNTDEVGYFCKRIINL
jgi:hypothetical protein